MTRRTAPRKNMLDNPVSHNLFRVLCFRNTASELLFIPTMNHPTSTNLVTAATTIKIPSMRRDKRTPSKSPTSGQRGDADKPQKRRGRPPRPKDMPRRPLSAYNIFFRDERQRILARLSDGDAVDDYANIANETRSIASEKKAGMVKFQAIARTIAARWKALSGEERLPYEELAGKEMDAYKIKKDEYLKKTGQADSSSEKLEGGRPIAAAEMSSPTPFASQFASKHGLIRTASRNPSAVQGYGSSGRFSQGVVVPPSPPSTQSHSIPSVGMNGHSKADLSKSRLGNGGGDDRSRILLAKAAALSVGGSREGLERLMLARRAQELHRREQALIMAEHVQRERQLLQTMALQRAMMVPSGNEEQLRLYLAMQGQREPY